MAATGTVTGTNVSGTTSGTNTGDQTITLTGDVGGSGTGSFAATIGANAVSYGKMQAISASSKLLGSSASGTAVAEITLGTNLSMTGSTLNAAGGGGGGTVTIVSVTTANGVSGTVATDTTTPAISLALGAITPTSVAATGNVTGSNLSGSNFGDQTITLTGDVGGSGTGSFAATIGSNKVTYAKFQQQAALSVVGVPGNATANVAAITGAASQVLRVSNDGTTLSFGQVNLASNQAVTGTLPVVNGGTGQNNVYTDGDILIGNSIGGTLNRSKITGTGIITVTNGAGTINIGATGAGSGDVVGPGSSGINKIARFVDTTGKLIGPGAWSDDSNDFYGVAGATTMQFGFAWIPAASGAPTGAVSQAATLTGRVPLYYDTNSETLYVYTSSTWKPV